MAADEIKPVRDDISERIAEFSSRAERLSPLDIHARMESIREVAKSHGLEALEALSYRSAQLALLPGHRIATRCCLEHFDEALNSDSRAQLTAILAALAVRLN